MRFAVRLLIVLLAANIVLFAVNQAIELVQTVQELLQKG